MINQQPKPIIIIPDDESTWPSVLLDCLNKHYDILHLWESAKTEIKKVYISDEQIKQHDEAHRDLGKVLLPFHLKGYHCTKLTTSEISHITSDGMRLQNLSSLEKRIDNLVTQDLIPLDIANELKTENQANDDNRAGMLWFCFYPPKRAGEYGIERFFRSWGGEALYNSHESNPKTGAVLKRFGTPCIIEADVPILSLNQYSVTMKISRIFIKNRGLKTNECCSIEDYSRENIASGNIKKVIRFPDAEFIKLSGCKNWKVPLSDNG